MKINQFSQVIKILLDDTKKLERKQWAEYLFVTTSTLSQWVNGVTIPRPDHLQNVIAFLERYNSPEVQSAINKFYLIANKPLTEIMDSSKAKKLKGAFNISEYLIKTQLPNFHYRLAQLPSDIKKDAISFTNKIFEDLEYLTSKSNSVEFNKDLISALKVIKKDKFIPLVEEIITKPNYKERVFKFRPETKSPEIIQDIIEDTDFYGKYVLDRFDRFIENDTSKKYRFLASLWCYNDAIEQTEHIQQMDLDEFLFIKIQGDIKWTFGNGKIFDTKTENVFSIKPEVDSIIPSSKIEIREKGFGIVIMYNKNGISLDSIPFNNSHEKLILDTKTTRIEEDRNCLMNTACIPMDEIQLAKIFDGYSPKSQKDTHQEQRNKKHLIDKDLNDIEPKWKVIDNVDRIHIRICKFPAINVSKENLLLTRHYGSEILIPIMGKMRFYSAGIIEDEPIPQKYQLSEIDVADKHEQSINGFMENGKVNFPTVVFLNGENPHAFYGVKKDCYCIHLRILNASREARFDEKGFKKDGEFMTKKDNTINIFSQEEISVEHKL